MQALIPLIATLSLVSGVQLKLWPYGYLSAQLPVYHQFQNTRTGEHAYSYAGGPSAKEEIKDADGVTRGSYSYVDANGILQSVFYVADEHGFRVAATDLPSDESLDLDTTHVLVARNAKEEEIAKGNRRKRSLDQPSESPSQNEQKEKLEAVDSVVLHKLAPISTSHQSQVQIHKDVHLEPAKSLLRINAHPLYQPLFLSTEIPLATSHQSQVQVHGNVRLEEAASKAKPLDVVGLPSLLPVPALVGNLLPSYHENRIELHKQLGLEGPKLKDSIKIDPEPLTLVRPSLSVPITPAVVAKEAVPVVPAVVAKEAIPAVPLVPATQLGTTSVTASISSHGISQVHPSKAAVVPSVLLKNTVPVVVEKKTVPLVTPVLAKEAVPVVPVAKEVATSTVTTSISSHGVSQIHGNSKIEPTLLVKATPIAQLHPVVDLPVYLP